MILFEAILRREKILRLIYKRFSRQYVYAKSTPLSIISQKTPTSMPKQRRQKINLIHCLFVYKIYFLDSSDFDDEVISIDVLKRSFDDWALFAHRFCCDFAFFNKQGYGEMFWLVISTYLLTYLEK